MEYEESMKLVEDTRKDVNDIRTACGFSPLKRLRPGIIGDVCKCPIANSLREVYESKDQDPEIGGDSIELPVAYASVIKHFNWGSVYEQYDVWRPEAVLTVTANKESFGYFIDAFDSGKLPKLDKAKGAVEVE